MKQQIIIPVWTQLKRVLVSYFLKRKRIGQNGTLRFIEIRFALLFLTTLFLTQVLEAQTYNYFRQKASDTSDYFVNIEWSINTQNTCDCVPFANSKLEIHAIDPLSSTDIIVTTLNGQDLEPWTGMGQYSVDYPGYPKTFYGVTSNVLTTYNFSGVQCSFPCPYGSQTSNIIATAQPLKNAKNIAISREDNGSARITWDVVTDIPQGPYNLQIRKNNVLVQTILAKNTDEWIDLCPSVGDTYSLTTHFGFTGDIFQFETLPSSITFTQQVYDLNIPQGSISGKVKTISCDGELGVMVKATLVNPGSIDNGSCWPTEFTQTTLAGGVYNFQNLYWGTGSDVAEYKIEAMLTDKQFRNFTTEANNTCNYSMDSVRTINLAQNNQFVSNEDFVDITSYVISGQVISQGTSCGLEDVSIFEAPPGNSGIALTTTDENGFFTVVVPEGNRSYDLQASFRPGSIADSIITVQVQEENVENINFIHTETYTVEGYITAGCQEYIGQASLEVRTPDDGCTLTTITTNTTGYYTVDLPARPLNLEVTGITLTPQSGLTDEGIVVSGFGGTDTLLLSSDTVMNFVYRRPLTMEISGFPQPSCSALPVPIMVKGRPYGIALRVTEGEGCPVDTGKVVITDNISGTLLQSTVMDSVPISNGIALYILKPGDPNFFGDNKKDITFTAFAGESIVPVTKQAIVTGARQRGANFVTAAPTELPLLILRDPPGDLSYSEFTSSSTTTIGQTFSTLVGGGVKVWAQASIGTSIFSLDIWGKIGASLEISGSESTTEEFVMELTNAQTFTTSSDPNVIGTEGDLFMGASYNFIYSLADELKFDLNTCTVFPDTTIMMSPDSFETTFIYTENYIREGLIPGLRLTGDNPSQPDSVRYRARNNIKLWEQVLQLNEDLKEEALMNGSNYSFDGALGEFGEDVIASKTEKKTLEFVTQIDIGIAAEVGLDFNNNGFTAGVDVNIRTELGKVESTQTNTTTTTRYRVDDQNVGDAFTIDIGIDPVYGTPVFKALAGQSSCPYEPPTARRDEMSLMVLNPVNVVTSGNDAFFVFEIVNSSQTNETRSYKLELNALTTNGAEVFFGSNNFTDPVLLPNLAPGVSTFTIRVSRPSGLMQYDFEGIELYAYPACYPNFTQSDLVSTAVISAFFDSPCSNIDMSAPLDGWLVNSNSSTMLPVTMSGYDLNNNFDDVVMQYSRVREIGETSWTTSNVIKTKNELLQGSTTAMWDVSGLEDGTYLIRFRLRCGVTFSFSNRIVGIIDRNAPEVVGLEKPIDDLYAPGKEISVEFDEEIDLAGMSSSDYYLITIPQEQMVPVSLQANGNEIIAIPGEIITTNYNQGYEIGLIQVSDMNGNQRPDTVAWQFVISEPDTDGDGVGDTKDRCPGGNDMIDTDMGGLPDDCDCSPLDGFNDKILLKNEANVQLDFDGIDDYIEIQSNQKLSPDDTTSMTFEAWVKPEVVAPLTILSKGVGFGPSTSYIFSIYLDKIGFFMGDGTSATTWLTSQTSVQYGEWNHVAVSFNSQTDTFSFYLNGNLDGQYPAPSGFFKDNSPIFLGRQGSVCNCNFFDGQMDEVRIWSMARSQDQIKGFMDSELKGIERNLEVYYDLNEGTPGGDNSSLTSILDKSGKGRNGVLYNFNQNGTSSNWSAGEVTLLKNNFEALDLCITCKDTLNAAMDFTKADASSMSYPNIAIPYNSQITPSGSQAITFEAWIKLDEIAPIRSVIAEQAKDAGGLNFSLFVDNLRRVRIQVNGLLATAQDLIEIGTWTHVAVTLDDPFVQIFINGKPQLLYGIAHAPANATSQPIYLSSVDANYAFKGQMDDIRFWSNVRNSQSIKDDLIKEILGNESGLFAYYNFNYGNPNADNSALTFVKDATANNNDAGLNFFLQDGSISNWVVSPLNFPDSDKDGLADICDPCQAKKNMILENMVLNGIFRAEEQITLGNGLTFPANANITLRAPEVKILNATQTQSGMTIVIKKNPCDIEQN